MISDELILAGKLQLKKLQKKKTPSRGRKDPLKFASLPTCGFVAQLVERPTSIWEARVQAPSKHEFFSGFFFCNFFNCSLPARINSSLITRRSIYDLFHILFVIMLSIILCPYIFFEHNNHLCTIKIMALKFNCHYFDHMGICHVLFLVGHICYTYRIFSQCY